MTITIRRTRRRLPEVFALSTLSAPVRERLHELARAARVERVAALVEIGRIGSATRAAVSRAPVIR